MTVNERRKRGRSAVKTPDGKVFKPAARRPLAATGRFMLRGLHLVWRGIVILARNVWRGIVILVRAIGKLIATIWRLTGALDEALWRGSKLLALRTWRILSIITRLTIEASRDFLSWLPSRAGRAYSAISGFVLIISLLWIADELSIGPRSSAGSGEAARAPVDLDDPILARIEGRYVHLSEIEAAALASGALREDEKLTPRAAFERQLVQTYVEQKLLSRAAIDDGLQRDPEIARRIGAVRDRILAAAYMEKKIEAVVTDEAVTRLYNRQSDVTRHGDAVRARQIVVATGEEAESILAALKAGGSFEELARKLSLDRSTAPFGGDLGYFTRDNSMTPEIAAAAFSTPVGEISPPFETEFGWHILQVIDRRATKGVSLTAVQDRIKLFLRRRAIADTLAALQEKNEVVYYKPEPERDKKEVSVNAPPAVELRTGGQ